MEEMDGPPFNTRDRLNEQKVLRRSDILLEVNNARVGRSSITSPLALRFVSPPHVGT
jgi:hypothetical protein